MSLSLSSKMRYQFFFHLFWNLSWPCVSVIMVALWSLLLWLLCSLHGERGVLRFWKEYPGDDFSILPTSATTGLDYITGTYLSPTVSSFTISCVGYHILYCFIKQGLGPLWSFTIISNINCAWLPHSEKAKYFDLSSACKAGVLGSYFLDTVLKYKKSDKWKLQGCFHILTMNESADHNESITKLQLQN